MDNKTTKMDNAVIAKTIKRTAEAAKWRLFPQMLLKKIAKTKFQIEEYEQEINQINTFVSSHVGIDEEIQGLEEQFVQLEREIEKHSNNFQRAQATLNDTEAKSINLMENMESLNRDRETKRKEVALINQISKRIHRNTVLDERWIPILQDQIDQITIRVNKNLLGIAQLDLVKREEMIRVVPDLEKLEQLSGILKEKQQRLAQSQEEVETLANLINQVEKAIQQDAVSLEQTMVRGKQELESVVQSVIRFQEEAQDLQFRLGGISS
jgi:hypothetical protein